VFCLLAAGLCTAAHGGRSQVHVDATQLRSRVGGALVAAQRQRRSTAAAAATLPPPLKLRPSLSAL
jgi:hypothetical protein